MFFIAYAFKGQVPVFAGQVKIVILEYFCPLVGTHFFFFGKNTILCILKGEIIKLYIFQKTEKILGFTSKYLSIFYLA